MSLPPHLPFITHPLTNTSKIPGGGVGIFNGCTTEWGAPSSGWGAQYGGISSASDCASFPEALQAGCNWRFGWFEGADNPTVSFTQVACPAALTANTGCIRADDTSEPAAAAASGSAVAAVATSSADPVATSAESGVEATMSEGPVTPATSAADPPATTAAADPMSVSSADPVATSAVKDDVCEL
jgi:hypothetical protein